MTVYLWLGVVGAALVAVGFALWAVPVALVVAGLETMAAAYVGAYLHAKKAGSP